MLTVSVVDDSEDVVVIEGDSGTTSILSIVPLVCVAGGGGAGTVVSVILVAGRIFFAAGPDSVESPSADPITSVSLELSDADVPTSAGAFRIAEVIAGREVFVTVVPRAEPVSSEVSDEVPVLVVTEEDVTATVAVLACEVVEGARRILMSFCRRNSSVSFAAGTEVDPPVVGVWVGVLPVEVSEAEAEGAAGGGVGGGAAVTSRVVVMVAVVTVVVADVEGAIEIEGVSVVPAGADVVDVLAVAVVATDDVAASS
mmetsp:Transcript_7399/g.7598  ORF Transcript_7399/g.7598 Transcript_7399/m.7598 type:complete len:256 (-) Transcript_7399:1528-2295(-)